MQRRREKQFWSEEESPDAAAVAVMLLRKSWKSSWWRGRVVAMHATRARASGCLEAGVDADAARDAHGERGADGGACTARGHARG
eukprot:3186832-Pleurochrysis_carterae.AAC.1